MAEGDSPTAHIGDGSDDDEITFRYQGQNNDMAEPGRLERGDGPPRQRNQKFEKPVKIDNFSGDSQPWKVWHRMFERICRYNGWIDLANRLFGCLKGAALEVACGLPDDDLENYDTLVAILEGQFGPGRQAEKHLAELRNRVKQNDESYRELGRAITKLCMLAYPESTYGERQRHSKIYFVEAVPETELRMMISTARPTTLDEAIQLAEEFDGIRRLEKQRSHHAGTSKASVRAVTTDEENGRNQNDQCLKRIEDMVGKLCEATLGRQRPAGNVNNMRCWLCGQEGHFAKRCMNQRQNNVKNGYRPGPRDMHRS
jgi:hypothetical protein